MRLIYSVLLPGIVVFVAKANLLQAHALRGDVADHPPSGLRDADAEVTADNESRMASGHVDMNNWEGVIYYWDNLVSYAETNFSPWVESQESVLLHVKGMLKTHFQNAFKWWRTLNEGVNKEAFHSSTEKDAIADLFNRVNVHLPHNERFDIDEIGSEVMSSLN